MSERISFWVWSIWYGELRHRDGGQIRVGPGVILDRVAGGGEHPGVLGVLDDVLADLEERGRHVVALEHRQDLRGVGTGPVVKGEGDDPLAGRGGTARCLIRVEGRLWRRTLCRQWRREKRITKVTTQHAAHT